MNATTHIETEGPISLISENAITNFPMHQEAQLEENGASVVLPQGATAVSSTHQKYLHYMSTKLSASRVSLHATGTALMRNEQSLTVSSFFLDDLAHLRAKALLTNALKELDELDECAEEEGFPPPAKPAKNFATYILRELTRELPRDYEVSFWKDGDVVVYFSGEGGRVSVYCHGNGGASFYVNSPNGRHDYDHHYQSASDMPMCDVIDAMKRISA